MGPVVLRARVVQGGATPEPVWQQWLEQTQPGTWRWQEQIAPGVRMVVVAPHPDDEVLACGALLAMHAQAGGRSLIVAVTDGEASHAESAPDGAAALAALRREERTRGLARLGMRGTTIVRLGLPDGQVAQDPQWLAAGLRVLLKPDDVVITTWRLDGHPDHDTVGHCTAQVCRALGCRLIEAPVWMWHWAVPDDHRVPWDRMHTIRVDPQMAKRKAAALAEHATQLAPRGAEQGPVLGADILARARRQAEYFFI